MNEIAASPLKYSMVCMHHDMQCRAESTVLENDRYHNRSFCNQRYIWRVQRRYGWGVRARVQDGHSCDGNPRTLTTFERFAALGESEVKSNKGDKRDERTYKRNYVCLASGLKRLVAVCLLLAIALTVLRTRPLLDRQGIRKVEDNLAFEPTCFLGLMRCLFLIVAAHKYLE